MYVIRFNVIIRLGSVMLEIYCHVFTVVLVVVYLVIVSCEGTYLHSVFLFGVDSLVCGSLMWTGLSVGCIWCIRGDICVC